jgi:prepilin-type N-terminal cleavage/methylation domain-containing protein
MKNQNGFSLVELLIVVAIIAIISAIAIPSLLTSKMASNEAAAMSACRTIGSAEAAFAAVNNQRYTDISALVSNNYLDSRFSGASGFHGYAYASGDIAGTTTDGALPSAFGFLATPLTGGGRHVYGIATDQVVRYQSTISGADPPAGVSPGDPIGKN